jgi:hypothetical protein
MAVSQGLIMVFWEVIPYGLVGGSNILEEHTVSVFGFENGASMFLQHVGIHLKVHMVSLPQKTITYCFIPVRISHLIHFPRGCPTKVLYAFLVFPILIYNLL